MHRSFAWGLTALLLTAGTALAADKGGPANCCADLEERVAELEATAARKGNRKVTLSVYGQVNYALLHVDADGYDNTTITNNTNEQSRFGFRGNAKIGAGLSAGFLLEIGTAQESYTGVVENKLNIRHSALYLQSDTLGTVWLGKTSSATDGVGEISVANTAVASTLLSLEPLSGAYLAGVNVPLDGGRPELLKYVSPTLAGFSVSMAWMANSANDDAWDAAVRWSGEASGFRAAAGLGYRVDGDAKTTVGSASLMHVATGIFANAAAGQSKDGSLSGTISALGLVIPFSIPFERLDVWHVQAGVERNWTGYGNTTLFGEFGRLKLDMGVGSGEADFYGAGIVQSVDAAALDLYLAYRDYQDLDTRSIVAGAKIRF